MTSIGNNITDLKVLIQRDKEASDTLQTRIDQTRQDLRHGRKPISKKVDLMESSNKDMTRELICRIEQIEEHSSPLSATDREMLQVLNSRLVICDRQSMQLAELRDVEDEARGDDRMKFNESGELTPKKLKTNEPMEELNPEKPSIAVVEPTVPKDEIATAIKHGDGDPSDIPTELTPPKPSPPTESLERGDMEKVVEAINQDCQETRPNDFDSDSSSTSPIYTPESSDEEDAPRNPSKWPLFYRTLDIDPATDRDLFDAEVKCAHTRLSLKHDPKRLPNDPDAPARWAAIKKAYGVLTEPGRKMFYDMHAMYDSTATEMDGFEQLEKLRGDGNGV